MAFYEVMWHGEGIGDGGDPEEALQSYAVVAPDDGDWSAAWLLPWLWQRRPPA